MWLKHHQSEFQRIKERISKDKALRYCDAKQNLYLEVDASKIGLGNVILQSQTDQIPNNADNHFSHTYLQPVAHASKNLTTTEQNYLNIERELLAVLHGSEKFHQLHYLFLTCSCYNRSQTIALYSQKIYY